MKKILALLLLITLIINTSIYTVIASPKPYVTFDFKDTYDWVEWINTADFDEIEKYNESNYSNRSLVEVPRDAGYILVPKYNGTNLSEMHMDGWYPISTFPAIVDDEIRKLGCFSFHAKSIDTSFTLRIFPIPSNIDNPLEHLDVFLNNKIDYKVQIFDHYAIGIYVQKPVPENFYSKFTLDKVMLSEPDKVVETFGLNENALISVKGEIYKRILGYLGVVLVVCAVIALIVKMRRKKRDLE